jgi:hypothetical protein
MYLQATTLSDITLASGTRLDPAMMTGRPSILSSSSKWHWFNQERPSESVWEFWRRACNLWAFPDGRLRKYLRHWHQPAVNLRRQWHSYYDNRTNSLLIHDSLSRRVQGAQANFSPRNT